jgi:hypothetical protein
MIKQSNCKLDLNYVIPIELIAGSFFANPIFSRLLYLA